MLPYAIWYHDNNTFTLYQKYLETSLKTIRYENKNKMDIFNPDIMIAYEKELADCVIRHKKLAAYAIFNQDVEKLFNEKELEEIKETMKRVEKGEEKTGLICGVANDIPIFIHMTFTEYFATEYICDLLKNAKDSENQRQMIQFIYNVMMSRSNFANIRSIIYRKTTIDVKLKIILVRNKEMRGVLEMCRQKVGKKLRSTISLSKMSRLWDDSDSDSIITVDDDDDDYDEDAI
ncbi:hypothetical protein PYW07_013466 [Mythimna separata]|uniref:Uncharacterized protein n=1 Tax=Mythimna separata TaxID=271217 RepID=A0AAD7Y6Q8_MYTSE|nr:hypothetical protein PYW07_013466 [Mythimna separata]